jgi:hypothetical protein
MTNRLPIEPAPAQPPSSAGPIVELLQANAVPVFIHRAFVAAIHLWNSGDADGIPTSAVYWTFPSAREDRSHIGLTSIVVGTPDQVARKLGIGAAPPRDPGPEVALRA